MKYQQIIKSILTHTEKIYSECWETLSNLKNFNASKDSGKGLYDFQANLATALFEIEKFRHQVINEEQRIIKNRKQYNIIWYNKRLKTLAKYKEVLRNITIVGKSLGDAFAWWFYRFDIELLHEHYNHKRTLYLPLGVGGAGELTFIKKIRQINNKLAIYHGITNILRIADVSFFDLEKFQIVSLGEIKTKKIDEDKMDLSLIIFGPKSRKTINYDEKDLKPSKPRDFDKGRLDRQISSMINALKVYNPGVENKVGKIEEDFFCKEIEQLYKISLPNKISYIQASNGLLFSGIKSRPSSFANKYLKNDTSDFKRDDEEAKEFLNKILKKDSNQNYIISGSLQYGKDHLDNYIPGAIPLFWFPIENKIIKEIYFEDFQVCSLFNPLHLIEKLEKNGFHVKSNFYNNEISKDSIKKPQITLDQFDLFLPFIINHLQTESSIEKVVEFTKQEFADRKNNTSKIFQVKMIQMIDEKYMINPSR